MSNVYVKLPDEGYNKLKGQVRMQLNDIFFPLRMYGQSSLVDGAIEETMDLIETAMMAVRGKKIPIRLRKYVNPRG